MVCEMGGKWLYKSYFVRCCFQELFKIAYNIFVLFPFSFFSKHFIKVQVVQPYNSNNILNGWMFSWQSMGDV